MTRLALFLFLSTACQHAVAQQPTDGGETAALRQQIATLEATVRQLQMQLAQAAPAVTEGKAAADNLAICRTANKKMLTAAREVLGLYQDRGFWALALAAREPVFGLKRVDLENAIQDYEDKLHDAKYWPGREFGK